MKPALLLLLTTFSLHAVSQNIHSFKGDSSIQFCLAYLKKIVSWADPHYIAVLDDGSGDLDNIDNRLFWSKKSVRDSLILHDSTGAEIKFKSPLGFLNFMYAQGFEMERLQPLDSRGTYSHRSEPEADIITGESCISFSEEGDKIGNKKRYGDADYIAANCTFCCNSITLSRNVPSVSMRSFTVWQEWITVV
jgi:hypothetical protein